MSEEWRAIPGHEGRYEVSNLGRVRSLARVGVRKDGSSLPVPGRILRYTVRPSGHQVVSLGRSRRTFVHHLVLEAFIGPRPPGAGTRHLDGDPSNNQPSNLKWGTQGENLEDMRKHGNQVRGTKHGHAKLTEDNVNEIKALKGKLYQREIAKMFGITQTMVGKIHRGKAWKHLHVLGMTQ